MNSPSTLFYEFKKPALSEGKIAGKLGLGVAVSLRKAETARQFFEGCQIQYKEINPLDAFVSEETRRGYAVFHLLIHIYRFITSSDVVELSISSRAIDPARYETKFCQFASFH